MVSSFFVLSAGLFLSAEFVMASAGGGCVEERFRVVEDFLAVSVCLVGESGAELNAKGALTGFVVEYVNIGDRPGRLVLVSDPSIHVGVVVRSPGRETIRENRREFCEPHAVCSYTDYLPVLPPGGRFSRRYEFVDLLEKAPLRGVDYSMRLRIGGLFVFEGEERVKARLKYASSEGYVSEFLFEGVRFDLPLGAK